MSKAIFKVTSKKITELLDKERIRKEKYMSSLVRKVKRKFKDVHTVAYRDDHWDNKIIPYGVVFKPDTDRDLTKWKRIRDEYFIVKGKRSYVYRPKMNTNAGKELSKEFYSVLESEKFFQSDEILEAINYKPKRKTSDISHNKITVNTFSPGWKIKNEKTTFVFRGYEKFNPPRGIKEMLMSEYERLMK